MNLFNSYKQFVHGIDLEVPLEDGSFKREINFDNAATTPPFNNVITEVISFCTMYSSTHRGAGYKSRYTSYIYDKTREVVAEFVGADLDSHEVLFCTNTTDAINKLANDLDCNNGRDIILSTYMEHHSNDLPWRKRFNVKYIDIDDKGRLDLQDLRNKLEKYRHRVRLVTVTGISNVTGYINDIHGIAAICHKHDTQIAVDAAQLAPHMPINMCPTNHEEKIDYLVFSAHKMYAPFGCGILIVPKKDLDKNIPERTGGGTVNVVTHDYVVWADLPFKEEAGSPNTIGAVALMSAIETLSSMGMKNIHRLETELTEYAFNRLKTIPNIILYGDTDNIDDRVGIIPFNIAGIYHEDLADMLSMRAGIAVRNGCFCAHPYLHKLLDVGPDEIDERAKDITKPHPGMVRLSFGLYNTREEIDELIEYLKSISGSHSEELSRIEKLRKQTIEKLDRYRQIPSF